MHTPTHTLFKPGTMLYPLPAVMVSCGNAIDGYNIITIAWTGITCSDPAQCYISVRPSRYSYDIIKNNGDFFINLVNEDLAQAADWCGVKSGRNVNKYEAMHLTPAHIDGMHAPYIAESPVCIACKVTQIIELGSHHMFMSKIEGVLAHNKYMDPVSEKFCLENAHLIAYNHGQYCQLGKKIGKFGWSVEKKKKKHTASNSKK